MENFVLEAWAREIQPRLAGQAVRRVQWDGRGSLLLEFGRHAGQLFLQLAPSRVLLAMLSEPAGTEIGALRLSPATDLAGLIGGEVCAAAKRAGDRILELTLESAEPIRTVLVEAIPNAPNLILLDAASNVLGLFFPERIPKRGLLPGAVYTPPPARRRVPLAQGVDEAPSGPPLRDWLISRIEEMSPLLAAELICRRQQAGSLLAAAAAFRQEPAAARLYAPVAPEHFDWRDLDPWRDLVVSARRLQCQQGRTEMAFDTVNAALLAHAEMALRSQGFLALRRTMLKTARSQAARHQRAVRVIAEECRTMEDAEHFRLCGEMLLANLESLRDNWKSVAGVGSDETEVAVINHYRPDGPPLLVRVNPLRSPQANAENYFKAYRKAQRGYRLQSGRLEEARRSWRQAQDRLEAVEAAADPEALRRLAPSPDVRSARTVRAERRPRGASKPPWRVFTSGDGYEILVGQSAAQNDQLTFRIAAAHDLWLHVADYTGSHVIVRNPQRRSIPRNTLIEAAQLAAYYSAARSQASADVRYTEQKHVQRVRGAAPGLVRLRRFQTVRVMPRREIARTPEPV